MLPAELRFRLGLPLKYGFGKGGGWSFVWGFSMDWRKLCEGALLFASVLYAGKWIGECETPQIPYIAHPRTNELVTQGELQNGVLQQAH